MPQILPIWFKKTRNISTPIILRQCSWALFKYEEIVQRVPMLDCCLQIKRLHYLSKGNDIYSVYCLFIHLFLSIFFLYLQNLMVANLIWTADIPNITENNRCRNCKLGRQDRRNGMSVGGSGFSTWLSSNCSFVSVWGNWSCFRNMCNALSCRDHGPRTARQQLNALLV